MLYYILPLPVFLAVLLYARRQKFDAASIALILAAIGLYYFHFYHAEWNEFTIDASAHAGYVEYIARHNALPPPNENQATRHPPAFYLLSAALYKLGQYEQQDNPLLMARHVSMVCFVVFILMSVNLLRLLLPCPGGGYYSSLVLLLFWPVGVTMGSRIMCDILLYAAEAGVLYALVQWFQKNRAESLSVAFVWSGVAMLAKNSGIMVLAITGAVLLLAMVERRRNWRVLVRRDICGAIVFAFICCLLTFAHERGAWTPANILSEKLSLSPLSWWHMFGSFNLFLFLFDSGMGLSKDSFWNMLLHSLMLGNGAMLWKAMYIPVIFNILWLAIMAYFIEGALRYGRQLAQERRAFGLLALFTFVMVFSMMVMRMRINNVEYSDARYIYPVVAVVALCHGKVMECHLKAGRIRAYRLGMGIAFSFLLLTPALFFVQYRDTLF